MAGEALDGGVFSDKAEVAVVLRVEPTEGHVFQVVKVVMARAGSVLQADKVLVSRYICPLCK